MEYKIMKSKTAFTMVELIFVIVIIGILAAIAVPRLSATRDDAKISKTVSNLKVLLYDAKSFYTSQGKDKWKVSKWSEVTDTVGSIQGATSVLDSSVKIYGEANTECFTIIPSTDNNATTLTVVSNNSDDAICSKVQLLAKKVGVIDDLSQTELKLGGQSVTF